MREGEIWTKPPGEKAKGELERRSGWNVRGAAGSNRQKIISLQREGKLTYYSGRPRLMQGDTSRGGGGRAPPSSKHTEGG